MGPFAIFAVVTGGILLYPMLGGSSSSSMDFSDPMCILTLGFGCKREAPAQQDNGGEMELVLLVTAVLSVLCALSMGAMVMFLAIS